MKKFSRRALLFMGGAGLGGYAVHRFHTDPIPFGRPSGPADVSGPLVLNDASLLSPTPVASHVTLDKRIAGREVKRLQSLLLGAREKSLPVTASRARHSQGGHSLPRDGLALTFRQDWLEIDRDSRTYRVSAGANWHRVIAALTPSSFSPAVMQSNNDFGVASSFSVNAHGWPVPYSGCGSTVEEITLMLASGKSVICSRAQNRDLFYGAMGGYGLLGIITELKLKMVPDTVLEPRYETVPPGELGAAFARMAEGDGEVQMAYGRMDISRDRFLDDAVLVSYRPAEDQTDRPKASSGGLSRKLERQLFRAQLDSDHMKHSRWWMERTLGPRLRGGPTTRNALLNEPAASLADRDPLRTDILHEYFVPPDRFAAFVAACQEVIPSSYQELLNITLRYVRRDPESVLSYAPSNRIAAVMLFSQERSHRAERDMARMTHALIERVLDLGGTYYLPYRPHATVEQFRTAYPRAEEFVTLKRRYDPDLAFRNGFWDNYLSRV